MTGSFPGGMKDFLATSSPVRRLNAQDLRDELKALHALARRQGHSDPETRHRLRDQLRRTQVDLRKAERRERAGKA